MDNPVSGPAPAAPPAPRTAQRGLAKWTSWGAAPQIFDAQREEFRSDAESLRALIGEEGWKQANRTVLN
uniref:hypothetical protein n=1 Tax=Nocardia cyriacigeorgica TaxID=135487 RepID=UPI0024540DD7